MIGKPQHFVAPKIVRKPVATSEFVRIGLMRREHLGSPTVVVVVELLARLLYVQASMSSWLVMMVAIMARELFRTASPYSLGRPITASRTTMTW
jgi:hypothetical protein